MAKIEASTVVVSGLPRSGTSMMMRMLVAGGLRASTDEQRTADEDNPLGYFEDERVKNLAQDSSWLEQARGKAVKVVSSLLRHLPGNRPYKIIFVRRDLDEVIASQNAMLERRGKTPEAGADARMRALFEKHLTAVVEELAGRAETEVLYVDHADVLREPEVQAARVNAFLGGGLDQAAMAAAVEPRLWRQRRR